ncbi:MAG: nickel pincer cofactor biosynthesis protein LarC [Actinomycetota bacterium]|nr:nickel pincer cofactor biosynthesis protein LarC [Actinomycetota bacterium]
MKIAFVDCSAGAAGDMLLGALIDAGASETEVRAALDSLSVGGWELNFEKTTRRGISATRAVVSIANENRSRHLRDIVAVLEDSELDPSVRKRAHHTFDLLAHAEARVHGVQIEEVHFHEVGALDALVDIVGVSAALESLHLEHIVVSPIATGTGTVRSAHGELPLPAPAVSEILAGTGASLFARGKRELVTPTGAALLVAAADEFGNLPHMSIESIGHGAGSADLEFPNIVRLLVGTQTEARTQTTEQALLIEANIDDMSPEMIPHVISKLLDSGAQDAWITPIVMKKGRPAYTLSVLCPPELGDRLTDLVFQETTTLGIRTIPATKRPLEREWVETEVAGSPVRVKVGRLDGRITTVAPEHDDAVAAAETSGLPLKEVYAKALRQATPRDVTD